MYNLLNLIQATWEYLNQPVTPDPEKQSVWKISNFYYLYQVRKLEACWYSDSVIPAHEEGRGQDEYQAEN